MQRSLGKLLCATVLASAALAQVTFIPYDPNTLYNAGSAVTVQLERAPSSEIVTEVGLAMACYACPDGVCPPSSHDLGAWPLSTGPFAPTYTNSSGYTFENRTVTLPSFWNGAVQMNLARLSLTGEHADAELQFANTTIFLQHASG